MKIYEVQDRAFLLDRLLEIWEASVRANMKLGENLFDMKESKC